MLKLVHIMYQDEPLALPGAEDDRQEDNSDAGGSRSVITCNVRGTIWKKNTLESVVS